MFHQKNYKLENELLITQQEIQTKALIDWLGLQWENVCLFPEKNMRMVDTPSQQQVREKLYSGSSLSRKNFPSDIKKSISERLAIVFDILIYEQRPSC